MIVLENEWLKVKVAKEGAELRSVKHKKNGLDYMWTGDSTYWGRVSPVLFPIVGRLKDGRYQLDGKYYEMSQHGFLRDQHFDVAEQTQTSASFVFESAGRFQNLYPYEFKAKITYILDEDSLAHQWEIVNENKEEMYFSIGGHPAFRIPVFDQETLGDYQLTLMPAANKEVMEYELVEALIQEKGTANDLSSIQLKPSLFANDALVYSHIDQVTLISSKSNHGVEMSIPEFPFVGVWSRYFDQDDTIAPFVCIEPWYGIADTYHTSGNFKEKFGINELSAGETFQAEYRIKFL